MDRPIDNLENGMVLYDEPDESDYTYDDYLADEADRRWKEEQEARLDMTNEQIEKALRLCSANDFECCDDCPIAEDIKEDCRCGSFLAENALAYIKRLKEKNQQLEQEIKKLGGEIK